MTKWDQNTRPQGYDHDNLLNALISSATWYGLIWLDSSKNMVPKELQIRSYLVSQPSMSGVNTFWSRRFYKCSDVKTGKHIVEIYPFERKSGHESCVLQLETACHPWSSWMGSCWFLHPTNTCLQKKSPNWRQPLIKQNPEFDAKISQKNQNSVQSELVEIVVPQSHYASEIPPKLTQPNLPSQPVLYETMPWSIPRARRSIPWAMIQSPKGKTIQI